MGTSSNEPLVLVTDQWKDTLLMTGLTGHEGVSHLFQYGFEFAVENAKLKSPLPFQKILGQPLSARLTQGGGSSSPVESRYFSGICAEFSQGATDEKHTIFKALVVPKVWLLTRKARSRIFQQITVKDILLKVLKELLSGGGELSVELDGNYQQRDFCVQYRETDFNFVSRLMEEEGIFYFFRHTANGHEMVVTDTSKTHPELPRPAILVTGHEESHRVKAGTSVVTSWLKRQELRTGKVTLWDHTFELPHDHLAATVPSQNQVTAGKAQHELLVQANRQLEIYDWPGEYAQRYDGVAPGGSPRPEDPKKALTDNERTTKLRMEQQASESVSVTGGGEWGQLVAGAKMKVQTLEGDHRAKFFVAEGSYVLTTVSHYASLGSSFRTGDVGPAGYYNQFTAIPFDLPFRPTRSTPKPFVQGCQSAVVVGPPGEEIFTDKYGRVKVQFHWDREGKKDADSSCWIRVATLWAGRNWGVYQVPRIGQEVLVDFQEGDPDQPIIVGNVYNPDQMPAYTLPDNKTRSYIKTNSSPGGHGYNEMRFEDKAGQEQIFVHAQKNQDVRVVNDSMEKVGNDRHSRFGFYVPPPQDDSPPPQEQKQGSQYEEVAVNHHVKVHKDRVEQVGGDMQLLIGGGDGDGNLDVHIKKAKKELIDDASDLHVKKKMTELLDDDYDLHVQKNYRQKVDSSLHVTVAQDHQQKVGQNLLAEAGQQIYLKGGMTVVIEAGMQLTLKGPGGFITIDPSGVAIQGTMVLINSGGAAGSGTAPSPDAPADAQDAQDAKPTKPTEADNAVTGKKSN